MKETRLEPSCVLGSIDFDDPKPTETSDRQKPDVLTSVLKLRESVGSLRGNRPMLIKPGKFDEARSLKSFMVQFGLCAIKQVDCRR